MIRRLALFAFAVCGLTACAHAPSAVQAALDPVAASVRYDSRQLADKSPFGAVQAGTPVNFGLSAAPGARPVTLVREHAAWKATKRFWNIVRSRICR